MSLLREEHVHPDDLATFGEALDAIRRGERVAIRHPPCRRTTARRVGCGCAASRARSPDGRRFADVIVSDVTDRAELTAELAATRSQLDRVLASVAAVAYTLELDEDTAVPWEMSYVGPGWERVTGTDRDDAARRWPAGCMAAVHPDDRVFVEQGYLQLARGAAIDRVLPAPDPRRRPPRPRARAAAHATPPAGCWPTAS